MVYNADEIRPKISGGLSHGGLLYLGLASKNISVKFNCQNEQNNSSLEIIVKNKGYQSIRILLLKDCKNSLKKNLLGGVIESAKFVGLGTVWTIIGYYVISIIAGCFGFELPEFNIREILREIICCKYFMEPREKPIYIHTPLSRQEEETIRLTSMH